MKKRIDPADIRKEVKEGKLEFWVENGSIYCKELTDIGERFIVGKVDE